MRYLRYRKMRHSQFKMRKRGIDICVISDTHLGSSKAHAEELLLYLNSIFPKQLIINGDFFDRLYFKKNQLPPMHAKVIQKVIQMSLDGSKVYYLPGNHDHGARKLPLMKSGRIIMRDKLEFKIGAHNYLFMHGDMFDAKLFLPSNVVALGDAAYSGLVRLHRMYNQLRKRMGYDPISLALRIKKRVPTAQDYIKRFRCEINDTAQKHGYTHIVCGHIHIPEISDQPHLTYMNSGDWVENLTALEFQNDRWRIYTYDEAEFDFYNPKLRLKKTSRISTPSKRLANKKILQ